MEETEFAEKGEDEVLSQKEVEGILRDLKKTSKRKYRETSRFQPASEERRVKWLRAKSRAKRTASSLFLSELRQRKRERGYFGIRTRGLRMKREFYERGERRSMTVLLLVLGDKSFWLMIEKTDRRNGRVFLTWPGGKAESAGEYPLQTAVRETREETGLDLSPYVHSMKRCGSIELRDEEGDIDVFSCRAVVTRDVLGGLHSKPHHNLALLDNRRLKGELQKPGRVSQNAVEALKLVARSPRDGGE